MPHANFRNEVLACLYVAIIVKPRRWPSTPLLRRMHVIRPGAANDFATIRARLQELRREPDETASSGDSAYSDEAPPQRRDLESRSRERCEGLPPPGVPTIFVEKRIET